MQLILETAWKMACEMWFAALFGVLAIPIALFTAAFRHRRQYHNRRGFRSFFRR